MRHHRWLARQPSSTRPAAIKVYSKNIQDLTPMGRAFPKILALALTTQSASGQWAQLGADIIGENESGNAGFAVHINADGTVIAVGDQGAMLDGIDGRGEVRVYMLQDGEWLAKGAPIQGVEEYDWCGQEVALDASGDVLAVSSIATYNSDDNSVGSVRVYEWDGTAWQLRGDVLEGQDNPLGFVTFYGYGLDLSADGNTVLICGPEKWSVDETMQKVGYVEVFDWNGNTWIQRGESVFGDVSFMELGFNCAMSPDGQSMVLGGSGFDGSDETGMARVYEWIAGSWTQKGEDLLGVLPQDELGRSVSIADQGNTIAVGAPGYAIGTTNLEGEVMVYDWDGSAWVQRGATLSSLENIDFFGADVSLSADGMRLAVTAGNLTNNDLVVGNAGGGLIYEWNGSEWELVFGPVLGEVSMEYAREIEMSSDGNTFVLGSFGFSPAGRTRVFTEGLLNGLTTMERPAFSMYPNPAKESVNVLWPGDQDQALYQLVDPQGRVMRVGRISSGKLLSIVGLSAGFYRLRLMFQDGRWTEQSLGIQP